MKVIATELFLLMSNLSQIKNVERLISFFTEAFNSYHPDFKIEFAGKEPSREKQFIELKSDKFLLGYLILSGNPELVSPDFPPLFQNSIQMLAILLEKLRQEKLLADEKLLLESLVEEKVNTISERDKKYRTLFDLMKQGVFYQNSSGKITDVNNAACKLLGLSRREFLSRNVHSTKWMVFDEDGNLVTADCFASVIAIKTGKPVYDVIFRMINEQTGHDVWFEVNAVPEFKQGESLPFQAVITLHDITERRKGEDALKASESKYRSITENSFDMISLLSLNGTYEFCNKAYETILGYKKDELIGSSCFDLLANEDKTSGIETFKEFMNGKPEQMEAVLRIVCRNGNVKWISHRGRILYNNNLPDRILLIASDITAQKEYEEKLKFNSLVLNQIRDNVTITDLNGVIIDVNDAELITLGYSREQLIGNTVFSYGEDKSKGATQREIIGSTIENGSWRGEIINYTSDGKEIVLDCRTTVVQNDSGEKIALCGIATDITEKKTKDLEIKNLLERLNLATKSAKLGIWEWNIPENTINWDDRMLELYGISEVEFKSVYETWLDKVHPDDRQQCIKEIEEAVLGIKDYDSQFRIIMPEGAIKHIQANGIVLYDKENIPVKITGINYDITEQKLAESERRVMIEILSIINNTSTKKDLIHAITLYVKKFLQCDAVGIRLNSNEDYPYYETIGFPEHFVKAENSLCSFDSNNEIRRDSMGNPVLECMCGNIIKGRFDPQKSFFTEHGSFWTNSTTALLAGTSETDRQSRTRNRCNGEGYESVGLFPFRVANFTFGLLQVNDTRKGLFTKDKIKILEQITDTIAITFLQYRTLENLQVSEQTYREILHTAFDGFWRSDLKGNILEVNNAWCSMSGYSEEEMKSLKVKDIEAFESPDEVENHIRQLVDERAGKFETLHKRKDGSIMNVEVSASYSAIGNGQIFSFISDITERKAKELELKQSYNTFYDVVNSMPSGLFIYQYQEPDKMILLFGNKESEILTGINAEDWIGRDFNEIWPNAARDELTEKYLDVFRSKENLLIEDIIYKDERLEGAYRVSVFNIPGERIGVAFQDISQIKKAELALVESEAKFRSYVENAPYGIFISDAEGRYIEINKKAEQMLGYGRDEIMRMKISDVVHHNSQDYAREHFDQLKKMGYAYGEAEFVKKDNTSGWWSVAAVKVNDNNYLGYVEDITNKRIADEQLKTSLKEKEVLIRELYHRTKNNMQVICAFLKLKAMSIKEQNTISLLVEMENRIRSMALVHQKLYQSQNLSRVNLKDYISELSTLIMNSYKIRRDKINLELNLEKVEVLIDTAIPCGLIINELVSNSLKYAFPGNKSGRISIGIRRTEDDCIELSVSDDGVGIPDNYNLEAGNTLGYQIVKSIAGDQLRGDVVYKTENGVKFKVKFKDSLYTERV